ncbi:hypothetical protein D3C85_1608620 [compost metagenome]
MMVMAEQAAPSRKERKAPRPWSSRAMLPSTRSSAIAETMPDICEVYCLTARNPPALAAPATKHRNPASCRLAWAVRWRAVRLRR